MASVGELRFSWTGFVIQSIADVTEGMKLVMTELLMAGSLKLNALEGLYYTAPATFLFQAVYILYYEGEGLALETGGKFLSAHMSLFAGISIAGLLVNFLGMIVIAETSGLVLNLLSIMRSNALVLLSAFFIPGNDVSALEWGGYVLSMVGFLWYTHVKNSAKPQTPAPSNESRAMEETGAVRARRPKKGEAFEV